MTTGPALCSVGKDAIIVAPISPEVGLPAGVASMLTPLLEKLRLRATPAIVVAGMTEASITLANPIAEVAEVPAISATVMA